MLQDKYYSLEGENERYMIQTRSRMRASGGQLPEVHGPRKGLDPHKIPEKQPQPIVGSDIKQKPRLGQGRAGVRRKIKAPPSQYTGPGSSESKPIIINGEAVSAVDPILPKPIPEIPRSEVLPPYLLLQNLPPPKPPDQSIKKQDASDMKADIEENTISGKYYIRNLWEIRQIKFSRTE